MARIVMKFGGTSVANLDRIRHVSQLVEAEVKEGNEVAVVVSAMSGETNRLVALVDELDADSPQQGATLGGDIEDEYDSIVATGEQVTSGLLAIALRRRGLKARSWLGWQIPLRTDMAHSKARIAEIESSAIGPSMEDGNVAVVAGFQGISDDGRISTLGRGGLIHPLLRSLSPSRLTAVIFTPMLTVFTQRIPVLPKMREDSIELPLKKCLNLPLWARKFCKPALSSWR